MKFNTFQNDIMKLNRYEKLWKAENEVRFDSLLKAQVSFSDHLSSGVCLSVCKLFTFSSSFHLLLYFCANLNEIWLRATLCEGVSRLFK